MTSPQRPGSESNLLEAVLARHSAAKREEAISSRLPDQLLIARLKRKKLLLKDELVRLQDRIRPDIIA